MVADVLNGILETVGEPYALPGSGLTDENARQIVAVCRRIEAEEGGVSIDRLYEEARKPGSPLHDLLDWNADKAAENYWKAELRRKVGMVRIQIVSPDQEVVETRIIVNTTAEDGGQRYNTIGNVMSSEERRADLLRKALAAFTQARDNLVLYPEASALLKATEKPLRMLRRGGLL